MKYEIIKQQHISKSSFSTKCVIICACIILTVSLNLTFFFRRIRSDVVGISEPLTKFAEAPPFNPVDRSSLSPHGRFVTLGSQDAWSNYVSVEFFHLFRTLRHAYGWGFVEGGSWKEVADSSFARFGHAPDILLLVEHYSVADWGPRDPRLQNTIIWGLSDDLHWHNPKQEQSKLAGLAAVDAIVACYAPLLDHFYPTLSDLAPRMHLPHAASALFLLPLNSNPTPRVLIAGASSLPWYPHRAAALSRAAAGDRRFAALPHPGYEARAGHPSLGKAFADMLRSHLAVLTDGSILNYTVGKVFEIPATGALLLVNAQLERFLLPLGFVAGMHYVSYTEISMDAVVDWVLRASNREAVDRIRAQGQALVWARHTVNHRAASLDTAALSRWPTHNANK